MTGPANREFWPDIASADDSDLARLLPSFDGRWSGQTQEIMRRFRTARLELDGNWASVAVDWQCPVCLRHKPDLARLTDAGVVLCRLDLHHDHLGAAGVDILWKGQARPAERAAREALSSAVQVCSSLAERFQPLLVCCDCNAADGAAKALLADAPQDLSFAPSEIARFIRPSPNRKHVVLPDKVTREWGEIADDVMERLEFMRVMADRIRSGRHVREGVPYRPGLIATLFGDLSRASGRSSSAPGKLHAAIAARSIQRDGYKSSLVSRPAALADVPTLADLAAFTANRASSDFWDEPGQDWCCAACDRGRLQILRRAPKSRLWTAGAHRRRVFRVETRPTALRWRNLRPGASPAYRDHETIWICKDCRQIVTDTKIRGHDLSDECLSVDDLRDVLIAVEPHQRPVYDALEAGRRAEEGYEAAWAMVEYDEHRQRCLDLFYNRRSLMRKASEAQVQAWQLEAVTDEHVRASERPAVLAWLLEEGRVFAEANVPLNAFRDRPSKPRPA